MKMNEIFPSQYLKAADLQGRQVTLRIESIAMEDIGDDNKPVCYFVGKTKGLVLNRTNGGAISAAYGDDTDGWLGKEIVVYPTKVLFGGKMTDCIRIMPPPQAAPAPLTSEQVQQVQQARERVTKPVDMSEVPF